MSGKFIQVRSLALATIASRPNLRLIDVRWDPNPPAPWAQRHALLVPPWIAIFQAEGRSYWPNTADTMDSFLQIYCMNLQAAPVSRPHSALMFTGTGGRPWCAELDVLP